jgi:hypothetical protein
LLALVVTALGEAGVPYMLTGSLAGSYHGAPRATQDVDLVVEASLASLLDVSARIRAHGLYVSDEAVREAVATQGMFNAIDPGSGWKVDFIVRKDRDFSRAEFASRREIDFMGVTLSLASAEDVVVAKLEWAKLGDSERQLRDVAEIVAVQGDALDHEQIVRWVRELGVEDQWSRAQSMVDLSEESL